MRPVTNEVLWNEIIQSVFLNHLCLSMFSFPMCFVFAMTMQKKHGSFKELLYNDCRKSHQDVNNNSYFRSETQFLRILLVQIPEHPLTKRARRVVHCAVGIVDKVQVAVVRFLNRSQCTAHISVQQSGDLRIGAVGNQVHTQQIVMDAVIRILNDLYWFFHYNFAQSKITFQTSTNFRNCNKLIWNCNKLIDL